MKVQFSLSGGPGGWHAACGAALLTALFAVVPFRAFADQPAATDAVSRVADVSLSGRETLAGALAQAAAIAATRKTQVAQRSAPSA